MYYGQSRHSGQQRPPRPKNPNYQPRGQGQPPLDPSQLASALKVRNFKALLDAAGSPEVLGVALEVSIPRVEELSRGERFTSEIAHHIESTLELPSGFLDQVNPVLTPETLKRLKSPNEVKPEEIEPVTQTATVNAVEQTATPPSALSSSTSKPLENHQQEVDMARPKKADQAKADNAAPASAAPAVAVAAPRRGRPPAVQGAEPTAVEQLLELRRANLAVLTARPGAKGRLGEIMGMSPANISHRLHGLKKFDDEQVATFSAALGLNPAWFDSPRTEAEVPEAVHALLDPGPKQPRGAKKAAREAAQAAKAAAGGAAAPRAARKVAPRVLVPADVNMPRLSAGIVGGAAAPVPAPAPALATAGAAAPRAAASAPVAAAAPVRAAAPAPAPAASVARAAPATASRAGSALSDEDLQGIGPIAEALLKTLALKARQGRLDEMRAIAMLTEAAQL